MMFRAQDFSTTMREALVGCDYKPKETVDRLIALSAIDINVHNALILLGAQQAVRNFFKNERHAGSAPAAPADPELAASRYGAKVARREFWDRYALFGQTPLKGATRPALDDSVGKRRAMAQGNLQCAAFEEDIMNRMKSDTITVGRSFKVATIIELAKTHNVIR